MNNKYNYSVCIKVKLLKRSVQRLQICNEMYCAHGRKFKVVPTKREI